MKLVKTPLRMHHRASRNQKFSGGDPPEPPGGKGYPFHTLPRSARLAPPGLGAATRHDGAAVVLGCFAASIFSRPCLASEFVQL